MTKIDPFSAVFSNISTPFSSFSRHYTLASLDDWCRYPASVPMDCLAAPTGTIACMQLPTAFNSLKLVSQFLAVTKPKAMLNLDGRTPSVSEHKDQSPGDFRNF